MRGSGQGLMQQVASMTAAAQVSRTSQTVGTRFRDQLKDLITRLDQYATLLAPSQFGLSANPGVNADKAVSCAGLSCTLCGV